MRSLRNRSSAVFAAGLIGYVCARMDGQIAQAGSAERGAGERLALQLVVLVFLGLRLYYDIAADPLGDEAYYWMWGQHPGWSYFDHPPLHAWLLGLVSHLAGWHPFSVRLLTWVSLGGILAVFSAWSHRLAPAAPQLWFWRAAAIYLASPLFFGLTMIAYNDHLLVALSLLAVHGFVVFADRYETGAPRALRWLYIAAVALGLAMLTKYNGAFVGLGFAAALLVRPRLRPALRTPHPWLAAAIAVAMQAPVLVWNLTEGMASARYHLSDRWGGNAGHLAPMHAVNFIVLSIVLWSPFLLWPLLRLLRARPAGFEARAKTVAVAIFLASTATFLVVSLVLDAYFYWNIVAFAAVTPLLVLHMRSAWHRWAHIGFGLVLAGLVVCDLAVVPPGPLVGKDDRGSSINFGWSEIAAHVRTAAAAHPVDLYAATRYSTTAQLGFALGTSATVKLSAEHSQYDFWQDDSAFAGKSALILVDEPDGSPQLTWLAAHFAALTQVDAFAISRFGTPIYAWRLFRGDGWRP